VRERWLAAARGWDSNANASADTDTDTDTDIDPGARRLPDTGPVRRDGRRHVRERWLAAARGWDSFASASANANANADSDIEADADAERLSDAGPVPRDGRRHVRERWLAATGDGRFFADPDTDANTDSDTDASADTSSWRLSNAGPVPRDGRRHLCERWLAATGDGYEFDAACRIQTGD
jgi:serine-aspartate repeat-containing protein C/D/E